MTSVTIVIPCYNEAKRLDALEFHRLAQQPGIRLLFVDDGSTDTTAAVLREAFQGRENTAVLSMPRNSGKGEAVRQGILEALRSSPTVVGFVDADLSTPVDEILRLTAVMAAHPATVVMGSRIQLLGTQIERYWYRHYFGRVFASFASLILRLPVYDTQCGAKFFRPGPAVVDAFSQPFSSRWIFDVEMIGRFLIGGPGSTALRKEDFLEVPLQVWRDVKGSKVSAFDVPVVMLQLFSVWRALRRWEARASRKA